MVGAGVGVTLIPEMAVPVATRSGPVWVGLLVGPQAWRRIGMIWRKSNPLADRLVQLSEIVRHAAAAIRGDRG